MLSNLTTDQQSLAYVYGGLSLLPILTLAIAIVFERHVMRRLDP